jgi:hypothetical protein
VRRVTRATPAMNGRQSGSRVLGQKLRAPATIAA